MATYLPFSLESNPSEVSCAKYSFACVKFNLTLHMMRVLPRGERQAWIMSAIISNLERLILTTFPCPQLGTHGDI